MSLRANLSSAQHLLNLLCLEPQRLLLLANSFMLTHLCPDLAFSRSHFFLASGKCLEHLIVSLLPELLKPLNFPQPYQIENYLSQTSIHRLLFFRLIQLHLILCQLIFLRLFFYLRKKRLFSCINLRFFQLEILDLI